MSVYGTPEQFVESIVGRSKARAREKTEADLFSAWVLGASACKTGEKVTANRYAMGTLAWRAWVRGFRAWERDAKRRK